MDLDQLIKKALEAKAKYGNIKVRIGVDSGLQALDTSILICENNAINRKIPYLK